MVRWICGGRASRDGLGLVLGGAVIKRFAFSFGVFLSVIAFPVAISSQSPQSSDAFPLGATGEGRVAESMSGEHIPAISGLPFFAKVVLETVSHLQDGTLITHTTYNLDARDSSGRVVLQVVVAANGRAENISVVRKLGYGLDQNAIETVKSWQFKPATGPDGNPISTVVPIEVTFRIK